MISPTSGYVLIKSLPKTQGSSTFIISAKDTNNQLQEIGECLAVGDVFIPFHATEKLKKEILRKEPLHKQPPCVVGQKVIFLSWTFDTVTYNNETFKLVKYDDIRGIIKD